MVLLVASLCHCSGLAMAGHGKAKALFGNSWTFGADSMWPPTKSPSGKSLFEPQHLKAK